MTLLAKGHGKDLRMMRKESGVTQKQLADAMRISKSTVSKIEIGMQDPSLEQIYLWARCCGFTAKFFFTRNGEQT